MSADSSVGLDDRAGEHDRAGPKRNRRVHRRVGMTHRYPLCVQPGRERLARSVVSDRDDCRRASNPFVGDGPFDGDAQDLLSPSTLVIVVGRDHIPPSGAHGRDHDLGMPARADDDDAIWQTLHDSP